MVRGLTRRWRGFLHERGGVERGRAAQVPASARARPVHLQLRWLEHERDDQRHHGGSEHDGDRRAGGDHAVSPDHGDPDDPLQQADRSLGPQALLHHRPGALRDRRPVERAVPGARRPDPRQLGARGHRHRPADPARLHPHHAALRRPHLACPCVRRDQRPGRHRRRGRAVDRRAHHQRDQLAGRVRLPGRGRRGDLPAEPPDRGSDRRGPHAPVRRRRRDPVRGRHVLRRVRDPAGGQQRRADGGVPRRRDRVPGWFFLHIRRRERAGEEALLSTRLFKNRVRTSASSRRTSSGCC